MIIGLLVDIKRSRVSVITSKYVQNLGQSNYIFGSQDDAIEFLIHILDKYFPDIDHCLFQKKVIESTICEIQTILNMVFVAVAHLRLEPGEFLKNFEKKLFLIF